MSLEEQPRPPVTGDPVVDAALHELDGFDQQDLDAVLTTGERLARDLGARLDGVAVE